jgi:hypothetical protein
MTEFPADTTPSADGTPFETAEPDLAAWQQDLHGLVLIGDLQASFDYCGHKIIIRTLRTDEELIVAGLIKEWDATVGATKAFATGIAALALVSIDGIPMPTPLGETGTPRQWAMERFTYAQRLYPWTIDAVYTAYLALEQRVRTVLEELGKASAPGAGVTPGSSTSPAPPSDGDS